MESLFRTFDTFIDIHEEIGEEKIVKTQKVELHQAGFESALPA